MTFFYDLNKRLANIADKPQTKQLNEGAVAETDYSAKKARAGKDIGKPGKQFAQIAKSAGERYGSTERGEKVAGAVLAKLRKGVGEGNDGNLANNAKPYDKVTRGDVIAGRLGKDEMGGKHKKVKEADMDESALQAYLGKKKYGDKGMKALQQAGREGASKEKMDRIRDQHDKMDESSGAIDYDKVLDAIAALYGPDIWDNDAMQFLANDLEQAGPTDRELDFIIAKGKLPKRLAGIKFTAGDDVQFGESWDDMLKDVERRRSEVKPGHKVAGAKGDIEKTATGIRHTRRYDDKTGETDTGDEAGSDGQPVKRGRGRPKGTGKSMGAKGPSGKSKLMTREGEDDPAEKGEYDREGDMALDDIDTIESAANELQAIIDANENLPEWVQSKINKAMDYLDTARDYMKAQGNDAEPVTEKAVSKKQQRFMGMVHAAQKGEKPASQEVAKVAKTMKKGDAEDFAKTKHKGLPEKKKKEETDESTTAGSVATAPTSGKSKGGFSFGKGIYDSYNREVEAMIAESINISMNANSDGGEMGGGTRSLTVTATDEDAAKLAALLKMAGLGSGDHEQMDEAYGDTEATENQPDYPTNQEQAQDNFEYSGGLNKPKASGMAVAPVTSVQMDGEDKFSLPAQMNEADQELARMREMAGIKQSDRKDFFHNPDLPDDEQLPAPPEEIHVPGMDEEADNNDGIIPADKVPPPPPEDHPSRTFWNEDEELARMREMAGIKEAKKPDYIDLDKDGNREESMKKAAADKDDEEVKESILTVTNLWKKYQG